jgi:Protein of unknown function (DUF2973)
MLHVVYVIAFTILAVLAVANLIRNLVALGLESQRGFASGPGATNSQRSKGFLGQAGQPAHPEMLDEYGRVINEPLLVMRSMTVEDARERLDALYNSSPGGDKREE